MKPDAAWRRRLDFVLCLLGLDELAVFQKRPAGSGAVHLDNPRSVRPEQVDVGEPPRPPRLPVMIRPPCQRQDEPVFERGSIPDVRPPPRRWQ